jgi:hypothetical protein
LVTPVYSPSTPSIVVFTPDSPTTYTVPTSRISSSLPDPTTNTKVDSTVDPYQSASPDGLTSPNTSSAPGSSVDPTAPDTVPDIPTLYPDTWKYFDFLKIANPFSFSVAAFIPDLPEPVCTYEIHRTFHVPILGNKPFDLAPCEPLQPLRAVLAWVFGVLSLFTCFFVIFRSQI